MEPIALMIALLIGQPLLAADKKPQVVPNSAEVKAAIERDIRQLANKPTGELTKADLEKVKFLNVNGLTDVSDLAGLTQLETLHLHGPFFDSKSKLTDVTDLGQLTNLKRLRLDMNRIGDLSPLAKLAKLDQGRWSGGNASPTAFPPITCP